MIGEYRQKTLCLRDDNHDRPCYLKNGRVETWDDLPGWGRYCKFVGAYRWKYGINISEMEVIEMFSHYTIKEWAEVLELPQKKAMNPFL